MEKDFGPEHPHLATTLNNLAGVLEAQARVKGISQNISLGFHLFYV